MRKQFAANVLFLLLLNLLIKPFWIFGIDAQVQNTLGNEVYGNYFTMLNLSIIFQILLDIGLQNYNNKTVAQSPNTFYKLFPNIMITKLALSLLYLLLLLITAWSIGYNWQSVALLLYISIIPIINSFYLFFRSNIAAFQLFKTDSLLSILDRLLLIVICGSILYLPYFSYQKETFSIYTYIHIQIITLSIACVIAFFIIQHHHKINWRYLHLKKVIGIIKQGLPFAVLIFMMAVYMRIDSIMIERFMGNAAAGVYGEMFRILDVSNNMSGVLIGGMLLSFFAKHQKDAQMIAKICKLANHSLIPLSIILVLVCFFWSDAILAIVYTNRTGLFEHNLGLLMLAFPFYCLLYIYSTLLTAYGKIRTLTYLSSIACIVSIVGNAIFLPIYKLDAALMVHSTTMALVGISCLYLAIKHTSAPILQLKTIVKYAIFTTLGVIICKEIHKLDSINTYLQFIIVVASMMAIYALLYASAIFEGYKKIKVQILSKKSYWDIRL